MRRAIVLVAAGVMVATAACRPPEPMPRPRWTAEGAGSGDLAAARDACTAEATHASESVRQQGTASNVAIAEYMRCMERRGWRLERGEGAQGVPAR